MMWLVELDKVSDVMFDRAKVNVAEPLRQTLRDRSHKVFAVGKTDDPFLILGAMPLTMLSTTAVVWAMFLRDTELSFSDIREGARLLRKFDAMHEYKLLADIGPQDEVGAKFARFCGFVPTEISDNFDVYEQVTQWQ